MHVKCVAVRHAVCLNVVYVKGLVAGYDWSSMYAEPDAHLFMQGPAAAWPGSVPGACLM